MKITAQYRSPKSLLKDNIVNESVIDNINRHKIIEGITDQLVNFPFDIVKTDVGEETEYSSAVYVFTQNQWDEIVAALKYLRENQRDAQMDDVVVGVANLFK